MLVVATAVVCELFDVATELVDFVELVVVTDALVDVVLEELNGLVLDVLVLDVVVTELEDFVLDELVEEELRELVVEEELRELVVLETEPVELDVLLVEASQLITAV